MASVTGENFAVRCLSLDLEVGRESDRIHRFAGLRGDSGQPLICSSNPELQKQLKKLDRLADGVEFLVGHNLIQFDRPHLEAAQPNLRLLRLPMVDTLRLSPLAFPRNPYHALVKHYKEGDLKREVRNDPELDARLTLGLLGDEEQALRKADAELMLAWHWLTTAGGAGAGFDAFFTQVRGKSPPSNADARAVINRLLAAKGCPTHGREILTNTKEDSWAMAYALAWLSVSGGNSVMPPWVRHQFPEAGRMVRRLRDTPCRNAACAWCGDRHNAQAELRRWFGFQDFRPKPADSGGRSVQQAVVESAMAGEHLLAILPTAAGKSLCYQLPALSRYDKTGALTVVISPLVALMADQVAGMQKLGITACTTINGLLSLPERADSLERVRLGDAGILIISPEQLRSVAVRRALDQREIGAWVLDEAHCLSKWGHDFRPDYRYVGRFIREKSGDEPPPPVLCLTATAKPDVREDIVSHFQEHLGVKMKVFDGGAQRENLEFVVVPTSGAAKFADIHQILQADLAPDIPGGAIVYCSTRGRTEEIAEFLRHQDMAAEHFHAGLSPETRKTVQERFIDGELRVVVATNAFGMGIDKPDVRLVLHADIPGSLENYLQEAGRAGRDQRAARCVLLYTSEDVDRQFGLSARSQLSRREIHGILRALRNLNRKRSAKDKKLVQDEVVATSGEILDEDDEGAFEKDSATDDTRVRTAVAWLEESKLLTREHNDVQVFPSSLQVNSVQEAKKKLEASPNDESTHRIDRGALLKIAEAMIDADPDQGISTDELMDCSGLDSEQVRAALFELERLGIARNDTVLTAYVHHGVKRASIKRLDQANELEKALIAHMREEAPDLGKGETSTLHLRITSQRLRDEGVDDPLPERLWRVLRGIAADGRGDGGTGGSLELRRRDSEMAGITLRREWSKLEETAELRRTGAMLLLNHLLSTLPPGLQGVDLLAETTLGRLLATLKEDPFLKQKIRKAPKLLERALLWLHEMEVIRLNKGLAVFRPAMTIRLESGKRGFSNTEFEPLRLYYQEKVLQIHVMAEFAELGKEAVAEAMRLAMDYFSLPRDEFLSSWLPKKDKEITRQTTPESWRRIVESLQNPDQQRIVANVREQKSMLVLAGPGSGKTRVLVHRIAYLLRVRRENPRGILALAYNRHAAIQIRRRLGELVSEEARGVTVLTCHAFAMRLVGASFSERADDVEIKSFDEILRQATALLKGADLPPEDADEQRERLLAGFRWILVDEYQDIGPEEYDLISAIAGRTRRDEDSKRTLFAVGDDDQNIYSFSGASVKYIRRFEEDYGAKPVYLTDNYRSTAHIIAAANAVIEPAGQRLKAEHPIKVNRARRKEPPGGDWTVIDPVVKGQVQILRVEPDPIRQAQFVVGEFQRLASLSADWSWSSCAMIAREWKILDPVRCLCRQRGIPTYMGNEDIGYFWRLREVQALLRWLDENGESLIQEKTLRHWVASRQPGPWVELLSEAIDDYALEITGGDIHQVNMQEGLAVDNKAPGVTGRDIHQDLQEGSKADDKAPRTTGRDTHQDLQEGPKADEKAPRTTGNGSGMPVKHFIEWLAEWGHKVRRRPRGLALLTAHSAKGLEFDHVAVLDGGWDKIGRDEDADATRRLYYVAMTRARRTLALARWMAPQAERPSESLPLVAQPGPDHPYNRRPHPQQSVLTSKFSVHQRPAPDLPPPSPELSYRHQALRLRDIYLSFAGRYAENHPLHRALAELSPGDQLQVRSSNQSWELLNSKGIVVGKLADAFQPDHPQMKCTTATVTAMVVWSRDKSTPQYQQNIRCDRWEVVVPELIFEPDEGTPVRRNQGSS